MPLVSTFGSLSARALGLGGYRASGAFSPSSLFASGEQGVWYDPSDLTTMFEDKAGTTPVHTPGNGVADSPVGALLDKRNASYSDYFDGTGDFIAASSGVGFDFGSGDFTIELWFYANNVTTAYQGFCGRRQASANYGPFSMGLNNAAILMSLSISGSSWAMNSTGGTVSANTWNHVAFVRNGTACKAYLNGGEVVSATVSGSLTSSTQNVAIGGFTNDTTEKLNGYISNLRIVKGTAVYTANFTVPTSPLTAISGTSLLTCGTSWSGNPTFTINGDTKVAAISPFVSSYSNSFDGGQSGTAPYISYGAPSSLSFGTSDFTVETWFYPNSLSATAVLIDYRPASTNGAYFALIVESVNIGVYVNGVYLLATAHGMVANQWYHIACCRSGGTTKVYINGVLKGSGATDSNNYAIGASRPVIGTNGFNTTLNNLNGFLSNFRIVNGTAVYTANFTPPTSPLTAITNTALLTCGNDSWSSNPAGTINGNVKPTFQTPFNTATVTGNHAIQATSTARPTLSARYNLLTYSEQFNNAYWTKQNMTVTADATTAPDGTTTADLFTSGGTNTFHLIYPSGSFTITAGSNYTATLHLKAGTQRYVQLWFGVGNTQSNFGVIIDTTTMAIVTTGSGTSGTYVSSSSTNLGSGWYRFSITGTITGQATGGGPILGTSDGTTYSIFPTSAGNGTIYIWGADLRVSNDGVGLPAYQRIADANTYDSTGFPYYLNSDGVDDSLATPSTVNFTGTNAVSIFAGVRRNTGGGTANTIVSTNSSAGANGTFYINGANAFASPAICYQVGSAGTSSQSTSVFRSSYPEPISNVVGALTSIGGPYATLRLNGTQVATNTSSQGTGNYANRVLALMRTESGTTFNFPGRIYAMIVRGASSTATEISNAENWVNTKAKIY